MSDLLLETGGTDNLLLEDGDDLLLDEEPGTIGVVDHEPPRPIVWPRPRNVTVCLGG